LAFEFKFPDVGEGIHEGTIVKFRVKEGDKIEADDIIADIETDKAVVEIPSPKKGTILKINHKAGDIIKVGEVLAVIGEKGEKVPEKKAFFIYSCNNFSSKAACFRCFMHHNTSSSLFNRIYYSFCI